MWHRRTPTRHLRNLTLAGCLFLLAAGQGLAGEISGSQEWVGTVTLNESVVVNPGALLTIQPGTTINVAKPTVKLSVRGRIMVLGTEVKPVVFASPGGWEGIEFMEAPPGSRLEWTHFRKAKNGISSFATDFEVHYSRFVECEFGIKLLRESHPVVTGSVFIDNQIGVDNEMKSSATLRNNRFEGHSRSAVLASHGSKGEIAGNRFAGNKQAIALLQRYPDRVVNNVFVDNETGIYCNQTQNTPLIEGNRFENNQHALVNFSFAYPALRNNIFVGNETAIRNDQYGSPLVENNLFRANGTAIYNNRKSNPKILQNSFEQNELALFCDFSSYPQVRRNNFIANRMGVKLGIYQSADWEKRSGSRAIMQREAAARQSQNPLLAKAPTEFVDIVDVSDNWWGDQTRLLAAAGTDGNVAIFHDRRDQPKVTYEGYGPESYRLDRIKFAPWLVEAVPEAGPPEAR